MKRNKLIPYLIIFALLGGTTACDKNEYIPQKTEYETFLLGKWIAVESGYYDAKDGKEKLFPTDSEYVMEFLDNGFLRTYSSDYYDLAIYHLDADSDFLYRRHIYDGENVNSLWETTDFTDENLFVQKLTFINENKMRLNFVSGLIELRGDFHTIYTYKRIK
ncbi:MAG: hypothetical protein LBQ65_03740 [Tannerellaceae bacterium]|jgi:hypothetical protein|nr:hypothetical protein [Tannerellaceae bacterium]